MRKLLLWLALAMPLTLPTTLMAASAPWIGSYNPTALHALVTGETNPCGINMGINWNTDAGGLTANGGNPCIDFDASNQSGAQNTLSQICSLFVNNQLCTSPIDIIFPDSGFVARISAGDEVIVPCITAGLQFYVTCESPVSTDQTRIFVSNVPLAPMNITKNTNRFGGNSGVLSVGALGSTFTFPVVPASGGVSILHHLNIMANVINSGTGAFLTLALQNNSGIVFRWQIVVPGSGDIGFINLLLTDTHDVNLDFTPFVNWAFAVGANVNFTGTVTLNYTYE